MIEASKHIYIHVPFCDGKCSYCGFYSELYHSDTASACIEAISREMEISFKSHPAPQTIYFGGGTPSILTARQLQQLCTSLLELISTSALEEWTVELNPGTITDEKIDILKSCGVNRISLGAQSFSEETLKEMNRRHSAADIQIAIKTLRTAGITNIGLDLIAGYPGVTDDEWKNSLKEAAGLKPQHISVYALSIEENSELSKNCTSVPDETAQIQAMDDAGEILDSYGYLRYEISNFALPGKECLHNLSCWRGEDYIGLGPAASSRSGNRRWTNSADIAGYIKSLNDGREPQAERDTLSPEDDLTERIIFGLRINEGVDLSSFSKHSAAEKLFNAWGPVLNRLADEGFAREENSRWCLTKKGLLFADHVASELIIS